MLKQWPCLSPAIGDGNVQHRAGRSQDMDPLCMDGKVG